MFAQFEEKGKIFTNVISKKPIDVIIQTTTHRIRAKFHIRPDDRIKDEMNTPEAYIALTDAIIFDNDGHQLYSASFLTVNKAAIVWLVPDDELKSFGGGA
jgi:hypothetical protein